MARTDIWTSNMVSQTIDKIRLGIDADMSCFHDKDVELKSGKLLFKLSAEEVEEFQKCATTIVHFVEHYCRFVTDKGRSLVDLREFQKEILDDLGEEEWKDNIDEWGPAIRNYILMASRQTGKCLFDSSIEIKKDNIIEKIPINLFYYQHKEHKSIIEKVKVFFMKLYNKIDKL